MIKYNFFDARTETERMLNQFSNEELIKVYKNNSPRMYRVYAHNILRKRGIELEWTVSWGNAI